MTTHASKASRVGAICKCGCGTQVEQKPGSGRPRQWIDGHKPGRTKERACKCGCGAMVVRVSARGPLPQFVEGHAPSH